MGIDISLSTERIFYSKDSNKNLRFLLFCVIILSDKEKEKILGSDCCGRKMV